jgi:acetyl esterase/lipase
MLAIFHDHFSLTKTPRCLSSSPFMAIVAQLVRAPACGAGGRRFESGLSPHFFLLLLLFNFQTSAIEPTVVEKLNLPYGEHARQVLDVVTSNACDQSPVILFFHGGSWRWGQKDYHREIGKQFAKEGIVFMTANYRLYPEVRFPAFPQDVARATAWVRENARTYGGDGKNLFLMGHSAGAHSASLVALDPSYLKVWDGTPDWIRGVIAMSVPYEFDPNKEFLYRDLFPPAVDRNSTMPSFLVGRESAPPFFLMHGRFDPLIRYELTEKFSAAMKKTGGTVETKVYASHGHFSLIRRTTSWHVWPKPLFTDVLGFVDRFRVKKGGADQGGAEALPDRTKKTE